MSKTYDFLKLMRVTHYAKNGLVFLPLLFSGNLFNPAYFIRTFWGFVAFSLTSSLCYAINDICDVEKDRLHPTKCRRPIAAGRLKIGEVYVFIVFLTLAVIALSFGVIGVGSCAAILAVYLIINIFYSAYFKKKPLVDIAILSAGFVLRIYYGGNLNGIVISSWLFLTVLAASFFFGLGKRRNELQREGTGTRDALKSYSQVFLNNNMYVAMTATIIFYALWCLDVSLKQSQNYRLWTIPLVWLILMRYSLIIEGGSDGDPVNVFFRDRILVAMVGAYGVMMTAILYWNV